MSGMFSQELSGFLSETEQFIEQVDSLSFDTAADLYDLLDDAAMVATTHIEEVDPELRVEICNRQDIVLERIVDVLPPFERVGEQINIFSPSLNMYNDWYNLQIMKDCALTGYLLARETGGKPFMLFGTAGVDYPFLPLLPGLELVRREPENDPAQNHLQYLKDNYMNMDVLILYGMYPQSPPYLDVYRKVRPDGKVYCALDMSTYWFKNIDWDELSVQTFGQQCSVIATSCRFMRDFLNRTTVTRFPCRWLPNGFYNPTGLDLKADAAYKENIILTVGRIGVGQKKNEELMLGFAEVASALSDWTLRLVGPIDPHMNEFIEWYFNNYPHLKERVTLVGSIVDKTVLYDEYAKAKVFSLTSRSESGTPNVCAEALYHGCMFVTSDIDGADDMTNFGELGVVYTRGDIKGLSEALLKVCSDADKAAFEKHIPKALAYADKYYDWNRNAKKLAYMLFK